MSKTYTSIVTHSDFDGVVCAALCNRAFDLSHIVFSSPTKIMRAQTQVRPTDIVCDLPYPLECGLWFDHHEGNLQDLRDRNIDYATIPGRFSIEKSCGRVVYDYIREHNLAFPDHLLPLVEICDVIDGFDYKNVAEWRAENPGHFIDAAIRAHKDFGESMKFLRRLVMLLATYPMEDVMEDEDVFDFQRNFRRDEEHMLKVIREKAAFLPQDTGKKLVIIDLTDFARQPHIVKNLAMIDYPEAEAILSVQNQFVSNTKTTTLIFSLSLSIKTNQMAHNKHCGNILQALNLGDGHGGAAGGRFEAASKAEMLKEKDRLISEIYERFAAQ